MRQRDYAQAYRFFMLESSVDPSYTSYYYAAVCALAQGDQKAAGKLLEQAGHALPYVYYYAGVVCYREYLFDRAQDYFRRAMNENGDFWQNHYYMGLIHLKRNRIQEASQYFGTTPDSVDRSKIKPYLEDYDLLVHALAHIQKEEYQQAIDVYQKVEHYFGYREIGLAYVYARVHEYGQCLFLLDSVITASTQEDLVVHSLSLAAEVSFSSKNLIRARMYLHQLIALEPIDQALYLLGRTYSDELQYDSAQVYFDPLPDSIDEYLFHKARTEYFLGIWGRAEEKLLRHREAFPQSTFGDRAVFILASINFKRKEYSHAIDFFSELVAAYPHSIYAASAQRTIGSTYYILEDYAKALKAFQKVKEFNPPRNIEEETALLIYETMYKLGKYRTLIDALRAFVADHASSRLVPKTYMRIAKILLEQREYYQSLSVLNQLSEKFSLQLISYEAQLEKAHIYGLLGNIREQKNTLHSILDFADAGEYHAYVVNELGALYREEMNYDSSLYYYNMLLEEERYREKAIYEIAHIYDVLGQYHEAETMVDKLIREYPLSVFLFQAYLIKIHVYKNDGNYDKAVQLFTDLLTKLGKRPEIYLELGNLYVEMEEYVLARDNYLAAGEYYKQNRDGAAQALLSAGDASTAIGDLAQAREMYLQAHLIAESIVLKDKATAKLRTISEN